MRYLGDLALLIVIPEQYNATYSIKAFENSNVSYGVHICWGVF